MENCNHYNKKSYFSRIQKIAIYPAIILIVIFCFRTDAGAFDTFWHSAASAAAGGKYGFSADAVNILQFGTFGPDFFGPLYDAVLGERVEKLDKYLGWHDDASM